MIAEMSLKVLVNSAEDAELALRDLLATARTKWGLRMVSATIMELPPTGRFSLMVALEP